MIICNHYGFNCEYTPTICDGPVYRWGIVSASRNGVMLHNSHTIVDTVKVIKLLKLAERAALVLEHLGRGPIEMIHTWMKEQEKE